MLKAIVDIGTNSIRLLVADLSGNSIRQIRTAMLTTRIGEGTGQSGSLSDMAIRRTVEGLAEYKTIIETCGVNDLRVVATSAVRDASNQADFIDMVKNNLGWDVSVLKGEEEAYFSYMGAIKGLQGQHENTLVVDIGGGSTEFVWPGKNGIRCTSLKLGAVRMTETNATRQEIQGMLEKLPIDCSTSENRSVVGVGGTFTTLAAIDQGLIQYDPAKVHGYRIDKNKMETILDSLEKMTLDQRKEVNGLQPERADIIVSGIKIAISVAERLEVSEITVSETDLIYGLLYEIK